MLPLDATEVPLGPVVEIILALVGVLGTGATWKWFFGDRKRVRVDNAQVVNDMAVKTVKELLAPITAQAESLRLDLEQSQKRADQLGAHLEQLLGYAIICHELLIGNPQAPTAPSVLLDRLKRP